MECERVECPRKAENNTKRAGEAEYKWGSFKRLIFGRQTCPSLVVGYTHISIIMTLQIPYQKELVLKYMPHFHGHYLDIWRDVEDRVLAVKGDIGGPKCTLVNIYLPNTGQVTYLEQFLS